MHAASCHELRLTHRLLRSAPLQVNEKCHAFSKLDQRIYEAKVLKAEFRQLEVGVPGQWFYFVHYAGWNKK